MRVDSGCSERVLDKARRIVDQNVDGAKVFFGKIEQAFGRGRVCKVGLQLQGTAAGSNNRIDDARSVHGPIAAVGFRNSRIDGILKAPISAENSDSSLCENTRRGSADAVIRACHDRDM